MNYIKRPEFAVRKERIIERVVEKKVDPPTPPPTPPIDINALANAIAQMIKAQSVESSVKESTDVFDNSKTLERLAKTMTTQGVNNASNFANLGNEHHTTTNKEDVAKTIDLLSNLND
jgi:hypothetical protein